MSLHILYIDDSPADRELVKSVLTSEESDFHITEATSRAEFENLLRQHFYDLVLSDVDFPEFSGIQIIDAVRKFDRHLPVIILSHISSEQNAVDAIKRGALDYVSKQPQQIILLPYHIHSAVVQARLQREYERDILSIRKNARMHLIMTECNRFMLHTEERVETQMLQGICNILIKSGNFRMVWIGSSSEAKPNTIKMTASAAENAEVLNETLTGWPEHEYGWSPADAAIASARPHVVLDIASEIIPGHWRKQALHQGFGSVASLPLKKNNQVFGVLSICESEPHQFDTDQIKLLEQLADDISYGILAQRQHNLAQESAHAGYDLLTGLVNRTLLMDRLNQAMLHARRTDRLLAVLIVDIGYSNENNEAEDLPANAGLLKAVAGRLQKQIRQGDTVSRFENNKFIILLTDLHQPEDVAHIVAKLLRTSSSALILDDKNYHVSLSIGATVYPNDGNEIDMLLENASSAMRHAREMHRHGFQFHSREMGVRIMQRISLENALRQAVEREEFELYYQPQIDLTTGRIIAAEALIRWHHPDLGMMSPARFIPLAEEVGLIVPIGEWVLRTACRQNKRWQQAGLAPVRMAVNLSARQFRQERLVQMVTDVLSSTKLDAQYLELELTESMAMNSAEQFSNKLNALKDLGVMLAIDDVGTGYSSLSYLKSFTLDRLKIDQSFIRDITSDADDAALTRSIIALGHSLNLKVVAEGVETEQQRAFLLTNDCDEMQGYHFSRPIPAAEFAAMLQ